MDACATDARVAIDPYDSTFTLSSIPSGSAGDRAGTADMNFVGKRLRVCGRLNRKSQDRQHQIYQNII